MNYYGKTKRNIKRALKAGGFYDTGKRKTENLPINKDYNISLKPKWLLIISIIFLILIIFMLNFNNITNLYENKKDLKLLKQSFNEKIINYNITDYNLELNRKYSDQKNTCVYDANLTIKNGSFENLELTKQYEILTDLSNFRLELNNCVIAKTTIFIKENSYNIKLGILYKNNQEIYNSLN